MLLSEPQRLVEGKDAELLAIFSDDPDFPGTDALVDAEIFANRLVPLAILIFPVCNIAWAPISVNRDLKTRALARHRAAVKQPTGRP